MITRSLHPPRLIMAVALLFAHAAPGGHGMSTAGVFVTYDALGAARPPFRASCSFGDVRLDRYFASNSLPRESGATSMLLNLNGSP